MDILLYEFFKADWQNVLEHSSEKGISKAVLRQLADPNIRVSWYQRIISDSYAIRPPHIGLVPKDDGTNREVMICEAEDRVFLALANHVFFKMFPEFVSSHVYSYKEGVGVGKVDIEVSQYLATLGDMPIKGAKRDMTKFFDRVKRKYINALFDKMESKVGKSRIIDIVREFYNSDLIFTHEGELTEIFKSIKQGTATSAFIADALLYEVDEYLGNMDGIRYWRYCDDILILGRNYKKAEQILESRLADLELEINEKKTEYFTSENYVKFLGFSLRDGDITISKGRLTKFCKAIDHATIKANGGRGNNYKKALREVNHFLYGTDKNGHSYATNMYPIINNDHDIELMNRYVMDRLRACMTGKKKLPGLGYVKNGKEGVVDYPRQGNVGKNLEKTPHDLPGYKSINCMRLALLTNRDAFDVLVMQLW